jgi:hypothetical protein
VVVNVLIDGLFVRGSSGVESGADLRTLDGLEVDHEAAAGALSKFGASRWPKIGLTGVSTGKEKVVGALTVNRQKVGTAAEARFKPMTVALDSSKRVVNGGGTQFRSEPPSGPVPDGVGPCPTLLQVESSEAQPSGVPQVAPLSICAGETYEGLARTARRWKGKSHRGAGWAQNRALVKTGIWGKLRKSRVLHSGRELEAKPDTFDEIATIVEGALIRGRADEKSVQTLCVRLPRALRPGVRAEFKTGVECAKVVGVRIEERRAYVTVEVECQVAVLMPYAVIFHEKGSRVTCGEHAEINPLVGAQFKVRHYKTR